MDSCDRQRYLSFLLFLVCAALQTSGASLRKPSWDFQAFCQASQIAVEDYPFIFEHHKMCGVGDEQAHAYFMSRLILDMKQQGLLWPQRRLKEQDYILNQNLFELEVRAIRLAETSLVFAVKTMERSIRQEELKYLAREWDLYLADLEASGGEVSAAIYREKLYSLSASYLKPYIHYTIRKTSPRCMSEVAWEVAAAQEEASMIPAMVALATDPDTAEAVRLNAKQIVDATFEVDSSDPSVNWEDLLIGYQ